ncbi:MAG: hypothetical protein WC102_04845 [Saccharofermentanales bacterium]
MKNFNISNELLKKIVENIFDEGGQTTEYIAEMLEDEGHAYDLELAEKINQAMKEAVSNQLFNN